MLEEQKILALPIFPFKALKEEEEVILVGFNDLTKIYISQIQATDYLKILFIAASSQIKRYKDIPIEPVNLLLRYPYTKIVICATGEAWNNAVETLLANGITASRIIPYENARYHQKDIGLAVYKAQHYEDAIFTDPFKNHDLIQSQARIWQELEVMDAKGVKLTRLGNKYDGGYVLLDDFSDINILYSIGINRDVSFDEAAVGRGIGHSYMYDHTIDGLPYEKPYFHWQKLGITGSRTKADDLATLDEMVKANNHLGRQDMLLKCDVEGAEWEVLTSLPQNFLQHFKQLVFEFHWLLDFDKQGEILQALKYINETHQLVHVHANNFDKYLKYKGVILPNVIEVTYARRTDYEFTKNTCRYDFELDNPCLWLADEIYLL